jgi:hypothetical protein
MKQTLMTNFHGGKGAARRRTSSWNKRKNYFKTDVCGGDVWVELPFAVERVPSSEK